MAPEPPLSKLLLWGSILAGLSYFWVVISGLSGPGAIIWKGAGVALLAAYAAVRASSQDGWLLAAVMALGALGDVLLEINFTAGAAAFALGHIVAIFLYRLNRRPVLTSSQKALAAMLAIGTPLIAWLLTQRVSVVGYALLLGLMAATAWVSRFPRYRTGIGAVLFVASDLLIFARMGPLTSAAYAAIAIWALYYAGQLLITLGVTQALGEDRKAHSDGGKTVKTFALACVAACLAAAPVHAKPKAAIERLAPMALDGKPLPFSKGVRAGDFVFLSGQLGTRPDGSLPDGMEAQARQAMDNVAAILKEFGLGWNDVVRCVVMLDDMSQWSAFNAIYITYFEPGKLPARSALGADGLARGGLVEVECTAYAPR